MSAGPVSWTTTHGDKVEVWWGERRRGLDGGWAMHGWYWHRTARNGRIVATSGEGYVKRAHCLRMAERINPKVET